ncbi:MAG: hypothetical protein L0Y74_06330 [candidate division Zixibacteria bacterium]|nr:hypothetical protein [candidate division Zixibacteria bacterium]
MSKTKVRLSKTIGTRLKESQQMEQREGKIHISKKSKTKTILKYWMDRL